MGNITKLVHWGLQNRCRGTPRLPKSMSWGSQNSKKLELVVQDAPWAGLGRASEATDVDFVRHLGSWGCPCRRHLTSKWSLGCLFFVYFCRNMFWLFFWWNFDDLGCCFLTCYFGVFHCRRAPLLGLVCFMFFTEFVHRLWIGKLSAICVLHSKTNSFNVFSICANSNLPVDVFKDRHRFLDVFALIFYDFYGCSEV